MIFGTLNLDLEAFAGKSRKNKLKTLLISHSFHLVLSYRLGCSASRIPCVGPILRVLFEYLIRVIFASDISLRSKIGPGLFVLHGHDIVIGANVVIGERCKIFNGVTLGNKNTEATISGQPKIGSDVVLSTGSKILGDIVVGSNVIVGANSVVFKDIPSNSIAVGIPATIKAKK